MEYSIYIGNMEKLKMIDYVDAYDGQLYFKADVNELKWWYIKTVDEGVNLLVEQGYSSNMSYGSDMEFASEAGFANDRAAFEMLMQIIDKAEPLCEEIG